MAAIASTCVIKPDSSRVVSNGRTCTTDCLICLTSTHLTSGSIPKAPSLEQLENIHLPIEVHRRGTSYLGASLQPCILLGLHDPGIDFSLHAH